MPAPTQTVQRALATQAESSGLRYAQILTEAAVAFHPGEKSAVTNRIELLRPRIAKLSQSIARARGQANAAERSLLAGARFPGANYSGSS